MYAIDSQIWHKAATYLGWHWSSAHGGYISENHRDKPNTERNSYASYEVEGYAEDACFRDGVETIEQAVKIIFDKDLET